MPLGGIAVKRALDGGIVALGAATCEDNVARVGADEFGHLFTGFGDHVGRRVGHFVRARGVAPMLGEARQHRLDNLGRDPRRGIVIEINQSFVAHQLGQALGRSNVEFEQHYIAFLNDVFLALHSVHALVAGSSN